MLLYTDGLVERRSESLDTGLRRLADAFTAIGADQPDAPNDDVALIVLRPRRRDPGGGAPRR